MMRRLSVIISLSLFLCGLLFAGDRRTLRLKVKHLACVSCAEEFKSQLASVCKSLTLNVKKGEAVCTYEDPVTPEKILSKARKTGLPTKRFDD